jgi:hypothetical protein
VRDGPQAVCEGSGSGIQSPHRPYRHRKEDGDYVVLDLMAGFDEFEHGDVIEGDLESSSIYEYLHVRSGRSFPAYWQGDGAQSWALGLLKG